MLVTAFSYDWEYWELRSKVTFDGVAKTITVNPDVTSLDIRVDVYTEWVQWAELGDNQQYLFAMRYSGLDYIPGGQTGGTFFVTNGWKLVYDPRVVAVTGVLYSDDYPTPYYFFDGSPIYPATVAANVYQVATTQNVVTGDLDAVIAALQIINAGVKKSSLLIPHNTDI